MRRLATLMVILGCALPAPAEAGFDFHYTLGGLGLFQDVGYSLSGAAGVSPYKLGLSDTLDLRVRATLSAQKLVTGISAFVEPDLEVYYALGGSASLALGAGPQFWIIEGETRAAAQLRYVHEPGAPILGFVSDLFGGYGLILIPGRPIHQITLGIGLGGL